MEYVLPLASLLLIVLNKGMQVGEGELMSQLIMDFSGAIRVPHVGPDRSVLMNTHFPSLKRGW